MSFQSKYNETNLRLKYKDTTTPYKSGIPKDRVTNAS